jgi:D-tagatose-1,6-bisphosphate aldolase subunit GatZ/KbaZ
VLRAAMHVALHYDTVLLVEATSNQVDQFGGYTGMTPPQFRDYVQQLAARLPAGAAGAGRRPPRPERLAGLDAATAMQHAET